MIEKASYTSTHMVISALLKLSLLLTLIPFSIWNHAPSVGLACAVGLSAWLLLTQKSEPLVTADWIVILGLSAVPICTAMGLLIHDDSLWVFDRPSRLLLAIPVFLAIRNVGARAQTLTQAAGWSAMVFGLIALWERLHGVDRVIGQTGHPIIFGNVALLMALICLAGLLSREKSSKPFHTGLLVIGLVSGVMASLASGSRGGWLFALPIAAMLFLGNPKPSPNPLKTLAISGVVGALVLMIFGPQIMDRLHPVWQGILFALQSDTPPPNELLSVVARIDMWREAITAWTQSPWIGIGPDHFLATLENRARLGFMEPGRAHAHNEVLTQAAWFGVLGLLGLLALTICISYTSRQFYILEARIGLVVLWTFLLFGLTDSMFSMMNRVELYAVLLAVCAGACRYAQLHQERERRESQASHAGHCQA
jgi:O-antigen ligase